MVNKIPPDLLFGGKEKIDHPLKADVVTTRRALSKQHDPLGPATAKTETDASKKHTHTITILHKWNTHTNTQACTHTQPPLIYAQTHNGILLAHKNIHGRYGRKDIPRRRAVDKIRSA